LPNYSLNYGVISASVVRVFLVSDGVNINLSDVYLNLFVSWVIINDLISEFELINIFHLNLY
jgi:hypothetical protein